MKRTYQQMLSQNIPVIFDGATGTQIQGFGLNDSDFGGHPGCNEMLCITRPDVITAIHASYLTAGANVIETNTFGANSIKLGEYGLADRCIEINKAAATLARKAVDAINDDVSRFVCASIGPTGYLPSSTGINTEKISFDTLADVFEEQAAGLIDGGVDILLLETMQDILEIRAALYGIQRLLRKRNSMVPIQVQVSLDTNGRMLLGSDIIAVLGAVAGFNPVAVGFNCNMGPVEMIPHVKMLLEQSPFPVTMLPNAGMPENVDGKAVYAMQPHDFAQAIEPMITREGVSITGGCCGTSPEHIRALAKALEGKRVAPRNPAAGTFVATGISGCNLELVRCPIIIGERLNTQGSKKTKELLLANNFGELNHIALEQASKGSSIIDLCVAVNERDDEQGTMSRLVSYLSQRGKHSVLHRLHGICGI